MTADEMRCSYCSSDVCSSVLVRLVILRKHTAKSDFHPVPDNAVRPSGDVFSPTIRCRSGETRMSATEDFSSINRSKADFSAIYVQPDPRAYFRTLGALGYVIPHLARPVFDQLIEARQRAKGGGPITVLDLGCSYGVNAAQIGRAPV